MYSENKVSLIKIAVSNFAVLRSLVILGVLGDTGEEELTKLRSGYITITVGICISTDSVDKLFSENTLIRDSFIGRTGGNILTHWFCGVVGNLLRHSPRECEEFATEAGIKEKEGVFGLDAFGININHLQIQGFIQKAVEVLLSKR